MNETIHQSINQSSTSNQSFSHSVTESINPSLTESLSHSTPQALSHWHTQSLNRSAILQKSLSETEKQVDESYMGKPMKPTTSHPTSKCIQHVQSVTQLLSHSVTESINPSVTESLSHSTPQSLSHWLTQSLNRSATLQKILSETEKQMDGNYKGKEMKPTTKHPTSQCIQHVQWITQLLGHSVSESINPSIT